MIALVNQRACKRRRLCHAGMPVAERNATWHNKVPCCVQPLPIALLVNHLHTRTQASSAVVPSS